VGVSLSAILVKVVIPTAGAQMDLWKLKKKRKMVSLSIYCIYWKLWCRAVPMMEQVIRSSGRVWNWHGSTKQSHDSFRASQFGPRSTWRFPMLHCTWWLVRINDWSLNLPSKRGLRHPTCFPPPWGWWALSADVELCSSLFAPQTKSTEMLRINKVRTRKYLEIPTPRMVQGRYLGKKSTEFRELTHRLLDQNLDRWGPLIQPWSILLNLKYFAWNICSCYWDRSEILSNPFYGTEIPLNSALSSRPSRLVV
jgi:hypothetical protein